MRRNRRGLLLGASLLAHVLVFALVIGLGPANPTGPITSASTILSLNLSQFNQLSAGVPESGPTLPNSPAEREPDPPMAGQPAAGATASEQTQATTTNTSSANQSTEVLNAYKNIIRQAIERHKQYPYAARAREEEGLVVVRFRLERNGSLVGEPVIETGSPFNLLNTAALRSVRAVANFPPFPAELANQNQEFVVSLRYSLN